MSAIPQRIVLVGLPGSGKSTAGRLAAQMLASQHPQLGWEFEDADEAIAKRAGRSIPEIFARQGEAAFRKLERAVTAEWLERPRLIAAMGGGWVELGELVDRFRAASVFVYLRVSPAVAAARIDASGGGRPLLAGGETEKKVGQLLARREPLYVQSHHTLSVDSLSEAEVASYIVALATGETGS